MIIGLAGLKGNGLVMFVREGSRVKIIDRGDVYHWTMSKILSNMEIKSLQEFFKVSSLGYYKKEISVSEFFNNIWFYIDIYEIEQKVKDNIFKDWMCKIDLLEFLMKEYGLQEEWSNATEKNFVEVIKELERRMGTKLF